MRGIWPIRFRKDRLKTRTRLMALWPYAVARPQEAGGVIDSITLNLCRAEPAGSDQLLPGLDLMKVALGQSGELPDLILLPFLIASEFLCQNLGDGWRGLDGRLGIE